MFLLHVQPANVLQCMSGVAIIKTPSANSWRGVGAACELAHAQATRNRYSIKPVRRAGPAGDSPRLRFSTSDRLVNEQKSHLHRRSTEISVRLWMSTTRPTRWRTACPSGR